MNSSSAHSDFLNFYYEYLVTNLAYWDKDRRKLNLSIKIIQISDLVFSNEGMCVHQTFLCPILLPGWLCY